VKHSEAETMRHGTRAASILTSRDTPSGAPFETTKPDNSLLDWKYFLLRELKTVEQKTG
jgi:hypothetical protein